MSKELFRNLCVCACTSACLGTLTIINKKIEKITLQSYLLLIRLSETDIVYRFEFKVKRVVELLKFMISIRLIYNNMTVSVGKVVARFEFSPVYFPSNA